MNKKSWVLSAVWVVLSPLIFVLEFVWFIAKDTLSDFKFIAKKLAKISIEEDKTPKVESRNGIELRTYTPKRTIKPVTLQSVRCGCQEVIRQNWVWFLIVILAFFCGWFVMAKNYQNVCNLHIVREFYPWLLNESIPPPPEMFAKNVSKILKV